MVTPSSATTAAAVAVPSSLSARSQVFNNEDLLIDVLSYLSPITGQGLTITRALSSTTTCLDRYQSFVHCELHIARFVSKAWRRVISPSKSEIEDRIRKAEKVEEFPVEWRYAPEKRCLLRRPMLLPSIAFRSPVIFAQLRSANLFIPMDIGNSYDKWGVSIEEMRTFPEIRGFEFKGGVPGSLVEPSTKLLALTSGKEPTRIRELGLNNLGGDHLTTEDRKEGFDRFDAVVAKRLSHLRHLEKLSIDKVAVGPETYNALFLLKSLTVLRVSGEDAVHSMFEGESGLKEKDLLPLRVLEISQVKEIERVAPLLRRCPEVRCLELWQMECLTDLSEFLSDTMRKLPMLEDFNAHFGDGNFPLAERVAQFRPHPKLAKVTFSGEGLSKENFLGWMESCASVTELNLRYCGRGVADSDIARAIGRLPTLTKLQLSCGDEETIRVVGGLKKLTHLSLTGWRLNNLMIDCGLFDKPTLDSLKSLSMELEPPCLKDPPPLPPGATVSSFSYAEHERRWVEAIASRVKDYYISQNVRQFGRFFTKFGSLTDLTLRIEYLEEAADAACRVLQELGQLQKLERVSLISGCLSLPEKPMPSMDIKFNGYLALRKLKLYQIAFPGRNFLDFVGACPALEEIEIAYSPTLSEEVQQEANTIMKRRRNVPSVVTTAAAASQTLKTTGK
jgi:hypothetical protein